MGPKNLACLIQASQITSIASRRILKFPGMLYNPLRIDYLFRLMQLLVKDSGFLGRDAVSVVKYFPIFAKKRGTFIFKA